MEWFTEPIYDITKIDENEIKIKHIVKKGIAECDVALIGVPFDLLTFGKPGARYAPKYIREILYSLNTYSYSYNLNLKKFKINDFGDILVSNIDLNFSFKNIIEASKEVFKKSSLAIFIGGEHSITYPITKALNEIYKEISLVIFDAHHDLRKVKEKFGSSGTFLRSILENVKIKKIIQIGIRDFYNSSFYADLAKEKGIEIITVNEIKEKGIEKIVQKIKDKIEDSTIYMSIDMDVIDLIYIQGVNSPSFYGLNPFELIKITSEISKLKNIKAIDIVEVAPLYENNNITVTISAYLILSLISSYLFSNTQNNRL